MLQSPEGSQGRVKERADSTRRARHEKQGNKTGGENERVLKKGHVLREIRWGGKKGRGWVDQNRSLLRASLENLGEGYWGGGKRDERKPIVLGRRQRRTSTPPSLEGRHRACREKGRQKQKTCQGQSPSKEGKPQENILSTFGSRGGRAGPERRAG